MTAVTVRTVSEQDGEMRLDRWFRREYPHLGHGQLEKLLRKGQVRVDGKRVKAGQRLVAGQSIRIPPFPDGDSVKREGQPDRKQTERRPLSRRDAEAIQALVLYRDDDVIVLNKPAGMAVQGGTGTGRHLDGMLEGLMVEGDERPRLVHRLDRDTSGVLILARHANAARALATSFRHRSARKYYWALVRGVPEPPEGTIDAPLAKGGGTAPGGERVGIDEEAGQKAVTLFTTIERVGKVAAWLALWPRTGRTHQIRAHCAAIGTPIVGDGKYGGRDAFLPADGVDRRVHLHARRLVLPHPGGARGGKIDVTAPLPDHMVRTWSMLGLQVGEAPADPFADAPADRRL